MFDWGYVCYLSLKIYSLFIERFPPFLFFRCFLFYSVLSHSARFHSAEGMVVIIVKDMLSLSSERTDKWREKFVYVVETFLVYFRIANRKAYCLNQSLTFPSITETASPYMKTTGSVEYLSLLYVWIPLRCHRHSTLYWTNPISFKWARKACLFNSVKSKKGSSSSHIQQFQRQISEARIRF